MHRNKLYKRIALVVIFVLAISAAVIYFTFDIRALDYLTMFSSWSVLCALGALAIGLFFDGTRLLTLARITGTWRDRTDNMARGIICDVLTGSNEAPLKRAADTETTPWS